MGCGCGKKQGGDPDTAAVLGRTNGAAPVLVEFTANIAGVPPGKQVWITGSKVEWAFEKGYITLVEPASA